MSLSPPELFNTERPGERRGAGELSPDSPLRAIPPDNLLVTSKVLLPVICTAAYRVHSFEWSTGAAAGTTAALEK